MKEKFARMVAIAIVSIISAALVAYLKDENNREEVKKFAKKYSIKFQKSARKAKNKIEYTLKG